MEYFGLKLGQDLGNRAAHPFQEFPRDCIKVFSAEGKYQHKFGQHGGGDGEFNSPCCMAVTKSKHLMVCDKGNNRIQVFELNGRFVAKFGTKGSNLGEFDWPTSLAFLSNGRIVVSDYFNHSVKIFE